MKTNTNTKKKILIVPAILLSVLFFNLSIGIGNDSFIKLFPTASACHKTYPLSGYEWTDIRASEEPCNVYCESEGYDKGTVTASGNKTCAGAECSYISDFTVGEQDKVGNDGHCGCNSQFMCACSNNEIKKPDLIVKDAYIEPKNPTTDDTVCLYATIKNIGTKAVESHDLTAWTYVNDKHASNTYYGKSLDIGKTITKEIFCSKYGDNVWFKKGLNFVKVEIDPVSVNIINNESNEDNNEKTISFTITESVPETICGNSICENGETLENCAKDCNIIYPSESDVGYCIASDGKKYPTTGEGAATWFLWNGCSKYKVYSVKPGKQINMKITGDSCSSCVCYSPSFVIYEYNGQTGEWVKTKEYVKPGYKGYSDDLLYTPKYSKIKVVASKCFYLKVYGETVEDESDWDVSIKFDKANKASFYPFSENEGETGKTYYSRLNESDNLYEEYVGGECCEYWSNSYYYNKYEEEQVKRAKGWYAERKKISDSKYKLLIRGIAWADCAYSGYGYAKGELNLNSDGNWKISEVVKCSVSGSNKGQETYCKTDEKSVRFAAGSTCGGCCACADSGSVNIEIIVEKGDSINNDPGNCLPDGTLIKLPNDPRIFVIKNCKKQWIRTVEEFKNNGYEWSDIKETSSKVINAYANYFEATAKLLRAIGHNQVYRVVNEKVLWVPTVSAFNAQGLKWDSIEEASDNELKKYPKIKLIKEKGNDRIFYVTNLGMKKHIINTEVFNSYNNKYSDIVEVSPEVISSFYTANLFKDKNGNKIYKIEGNEKRWIKTAEAFKKMKYDWSKVVPANKTELDAYQDGEDME
ncbi:hypothetical protein KAT63_01095 [Candidatus Parcubacteria bacterium]|nr:hypothetical protein [Candidatus Parcubacteria bacterium]